MEIKVLGTGCQKCKELDKMVREALAEMNVAANVEKVEDIGQIVQYGVMLTPGLVINGKVKISGRLPNKADIKKMIEEENK
ncbi:thioredoxin family protein [Desulforamulus hydrothermalis]|uniref:Redox-active disulfide protein 2 n=1 Tax=Desulforamulus hydrothermalis Lam5 = DSM 18033 TaxID=1121428 RepID=K8E9D5_9FIRM|nr:thioredoxin family protein [Desulforamulus hydrothermalis]CCO08168.1 Redox-active disulfide protein 2 [Desulforamulus hydrothermalis Lam5 = DSM 18033]SHH23333.1 small redox-active disulfide protein 2 [Desulforamulus hydrothermalis Lam5 = DSM 18033]